MATPLNELSNERPEWATAATGNYAIKRESYSDENYVRKRMWELSEGPKKRLNVWTWRGAKFGSTLSIYANSKCLPELAKAMGVLFPTATAVFISGQKKMILFSLDGKLLPRPIPFDHESFNENPANDWGLVRDMPKKLDQIRNKRGQPESVRSIKAWINVDSAEVITFPPIQKFEKPLLDDPKRFGIEGAKSILQARIMAERGGWVAFGINAEDHKVVAVVQAMNDEQAKKASKAMFAIKKVKWSVLKVVTNDGTQTFDNEDDIAEYCGAKAHYI